MERLFRFIDTRFKPEAYQAIQSGHITSLAQLNQAFNAWCEGYYPRRRHGTTKQAPIQRAAESARKTRRVSVTALLEVFLWEETRKVDKTGCISLEGNPYEVDLVLVGQKATLRYDPFDLQHIQVWYKGQRMADARPLDVRRRLDHRVKPEERTTPQARSDEQTLQFFSLAEHARQKALDSLTFQRREEEKA